jgi:hypothetical protein
VLGDIEVVVGIATGGETRAAVDVLNAATGKDAELEDVAEQLRDPNVLTIHYDSGHVVMNRQVFAVRHRDQPFTGWAWADFAQYDVGQEKPDKLTDLGIKKQKSLFDWMVAEWSSLMGGAAKSGWLACDDRAGETADFIHLDESSSVPILSLIHVKSAHSRKVTRGISVVAYETVGSQAVKNLRHLDTMLLSPTLEGGSTKLIVKLVWENGKPRTRGRFVNHLKSLNANYKRRVVIVQPHILQSRLNAVRTGTPKLAADVNRCRQLDTLLLGFQANIRGLGAEFIVVGDSA